MEMTNNIVGNIDLVEILFTLFWVFFVALIIYLQREAKREGYPLESDRGGTVVVRGFPREPRNKKVFLKPHGGEAYAPRDEVERELAAKPAAGFPGAPLVPTGDPLVDGIGPAAWSGREDVPDLTYHGKPRIVPMRTQADFSIDARDPDPRGMEVIAADGKTAGTVVDAWIDIPEPMIVYVEVELDPSVGTGRVLMPFSFARINKSRGRLETRTLVSGQFARAPRLQSPDTVTLLEEDKIMGYFGGGLLYAEPGRQEPLL